MNNCLILLCLFASLSLSIHWVSPGCVPEIRCTHNRTTRCRCPLWVFDWSDRRDFCGHEFHDTGRNCDDQSIYICYPEGPSPEVTKALKQQYLAFANFFKPCYPNDWPSTYCGLKCWSNHISNCSTHCYRSKDEAEKSIKTVYGNNKPWEKR